MGKAIRETDLYEPVKQLLEGQGYEVKGEVGSADIVGCRDVDSIVVVELKTSFSLSLFHQAIERLALTDNVYVAVPRGSGRAFLKALKSNTGLCRRLGIGLITVRLSDGFVQIHLDPGPYKPRQSKAKQSRLLREFAKRVGDPNAGGATAKRSNRRPIGRTRCGACRFCIRMDRQRLQRLRKQARLSEPDGLWLIIITAGSSAWNTGVYGLTPNGIEAIDSYAGELQRLAKKA